ncbi:MAG TPA: PP2C family protein-serine/threonine phosphatase [Terriglobia bacterium]|jgi:serine phosphatase RsbU (regulator of sigma subunit)|nr:PP2C family protein-serine/threonine phosphatase [Terriglobia bacterium]
MQRPQRIGLERTLENIGESLLRVGRGVDGFWQRVTEGIAIQTLWSQFQAEARASYDLYSREVDWEALRQETRLRRFWKITVALFWAMLMKLSPARRVFLLIALAFAILSLTRVHRGENPPPSAFNPYQALSIACLIFLLALELADRVIMKRDLEIAREIQRWLVPSAPPQVEGVDIAFASRPANTVGGDYFDAFVREVSSSGIVSRRLLLVVADVAGKSVPAALLMATFQASLRTLANEPASLRDLVTGLNRYACAHSLGGRRFTTALFAELDPATRELSYIRAGHCAPILRRASMSLERLDAGHIPLGIDAGASFGCGSTRLAPGDLLVVYTDGVIEAVNQKNEEFEEARLLNTIKTLPAGSAADSLRRLTAAVDAFVGETRQHDDITWLLVRAL